jgi:hypothetical protein
MRRSIGRASLKKSSETPIGRTPSIAVLLVRGVVWESLPNPAPELDLNGFFGD